MGSSIQNFLSPMAAATTLPCADETHDGSVLGVSEEQHSRPESTAAEFRPPPLFSTPPANSVPTTALTMCVCGCTQVCVCVYECVRVQMRVCECCVCVYAS